VEGQPRGQLKKTRDEAKPRAADFRSWIDGNSREKKKNPSLGSRPPWRKTRKSFAVRPGTLKGDVWVGNV